MPKSCSEIGRQNYIMISEVNFFDFLNLHCLYIFKRMFRLEIYSEAMRFIPKSVSVPIRTHPNNPKKVFNLV